MTALRVASNLGKRRGAHAVAVAACLTACACRTSSKSLPAAQDAQGTTAVVGDVDGDGNADELAHDDGCGTQGCAFYLALGPRKTRANTFSAFAKDCEILATRTGGHADIECVHVVRVEARGPSTIRVTNRYRWDGQRYVSALDHLSDLHPARPLTSARCSTVRLRAATEALLLPAIGVRISQPTAGGAAGIRVGAPHTPVVAALAENCLLAVVEEVDSAADGRWLAVALGEHSRGWIRAVATECVDASAAAAGPEAAR